MKDLRPGLQPTLNQERKRSVLFVTRQSIFQAWAKVHLSATWLARNTRILCKMNGFHLLSSILYPIARKMKGKN